MIVAEQQQTFFNICNMVYTMIASTTPVDTRNLLNHTSMYSSLQGNECTIEIYAPKVTKKGNDDYAQYVNYCPKLRGGKTNKNYHYIEKAIIQACNIIAEGIGAVVINEL